MSELQNINLFSRKNQWFCVEKFLFVSFGFLFFNATKGKHRG